MRHETILKRLKEALAEKNLLKAYKKLSVLTYELEAYLKREEEKRARYAGAIRHLMKWYKELWNNKPPEALSRVSWEDAVAKVLRELVMIYEQNKQDVEQLKRDYEEFKKNEKRWFAGDKSISRFRQVLPQLKQESQKKWTSPETERGLSYYFSDDDNIEW